MVWQNFQQGLVVTGVGMGLVFLTLLLVMAMIWLLDRVFKATPEEAAPAVVPPPPAAFAAPAAPVVPTQVDDGADLVAAIAVVIALQGAVAADEPVYEDIDGETVTVTMIDPGPGTWKAHGRAQAVK